MQLDRLWRHLGLGLLCNALSSAAAQAAPAYTELISPDAQAGAGFGYAFGSLPDLTGDGIGEFYVVQLQMYVYDGKNLNLLYSPGCYSAACSAADINADGIPDLLATRGCDLSGVGAVDVLDGKTGKSLATLKSPKPVNAGYFGQTLQLLPDMTGDGKEDWLVHQPEYQSHAGRVYVFHSQTREVVRTIENTETANRFWMEFVEVLPDVDGDGKPELLVATKTASVTRDGHTFSNAGRAIVRSIQTGAVLYELMDPEPQKDGWFGFALNSLGDVNADGIGDMAIGTFTKDSFTGVLYVFSGKDGKWLRTVHSPNPTSSGRFGRKVIAFPDVNGDGVRDFWTQEDGLQLTHVFDGATGGLLKTIEYPGVFANAFFIDAVRQQAAPGIRAYLFASEFVENREGRVYYLPATHTGPPRFNALGPSPAVFRVQVFGEPGRNLEIQSTGDLMTWEPLTTVTFGDQPADIQDPAATRHPQRFYRGFQKQ